MGLFLLYSDSKTAIKILDQGQTKNKLFLPYLSEFNELAPKFPLLVLQWIPEIKNKGADNLARQGLEKSYRTGDSKREKRCLKFNQ